MANHPNRSKKSQYELSVLSEGRRIAWSTSHPQTAHKWFRFTVDTGRTIDTGSTVTLVSLCRDGTEIKKAKVERSLIAR